MSRKKQKERKIQNRKKRVKTKLLKRKTSIRAHRKLENELESLKKMQEEKLTPFVKKYDT